MPRPINVRIKRIDSKHKDLPLPTRMTEHAAGFDLAAAVEQPTQMEPGEIKLIACGFAMAVPEGYEAQVRPRSGLASKFGITMVNAPGTIDADYRGEVKVPLINLGKQAFTIERGMRIAQMVFAQVETAVWREVGSVSELSATERGSGGFGSTG